MSFNMERWYNAAGQRFSVRKYAGDPSDSDWESLKETAVMLSAKGVRIVLAQARSVFLSNFLGMGKVRGTTSFAALITDKSTQHTSVGYLGEAFILECAAMGLGTCWLGASYNRHNLIKTISNSAMLAPGEKIACVISVGIPNEKYAARPRKSLEDLTGLQSGVLTNLPEWQQRALECARLAPSAVNAQPWRFYVDGDTLAIKNTNWNFGFGLLDCGIAMLHMELGASHCGVCGEWRIMSGGAIFKPSAYGL